jgi:hypothetical protein
MVVLIFGASPCVRAQRSANFQLEGTALNQGGRPSGGQFAQSASFQITLDVVGDAVPPVAASSPSFGLSGGTAGSYAPAGEVQGAAFDQPGFPTGAISWTAMPTAVRYNLYRGATGTLPGSFGSCLASNIPNTYYSDPALPSSKAGYFYLTTGENRLGEQGTKGFQSNGMQRTSSPICP